MLHKVVLTFESIVEILKCAVPYKFQLNLLSIEQFPRPTGGLFILNKSGFNFWLNLQ